MTKRYKGKVPVVPEQTPDDMEVQAEQIGDDVIRAFNAWIRPELAKIIGWPAVEGIQNQDFESVLKSQYKMLFIERGYTVRHRGATFSFKLMQGIPGKATCLSKFKYNVDFDAYKET